VKKLFVRGILVLLGVIVLLICAGLTWRTIHQHRAAKDITPPALAKTYFDQVTAPPEGDSVKFRKRVTWL